MIHVKWGRDVLHFPIPPPDTPLGKLRTDLAEYTHLPVASFKLVHKGAVMKDDMAPLSTYKLKENATITLIGGHTLSEKPPTTAGASSGAASSTAAATAPKPSKAPQTEEGTIMAIRAELDRVREMLVPDVDAFVQALAPPCNEPPTQTHAVAESFPVPAPPSAPSSRPTPLDHTRLSELLLQSLLRLDALHVSGADWPDARMERKSAVREVQGVLDRLDGAWAGR